MILQKFCIILIISFFSSPLPQPLGTRGAAVKKRAGSGVTKLFFPTLLNEIPINATRCQTMIYQKLIHGIQKDERGTWIRDMCRSPILLQLSDIVNSFNFATPTKVFPKISGLTEASITCSKTN